MDDSSDDAADNTAQKIRAADDRSSGRDATVQMKSSGRGVVDETPHTDEEQRTRSSGNETPRTKRAADDTVGNASDDAADTTRRMAINRWVEFYSTLNDSATTMTGTSRRNYVYINNVPVL